MRFLPSVAVALAVVTTAPTATAMGFARSTTQSTLGQPLSFVASISLEPDETLSRECVSAEVFAGDIKVVPPNVHVAVGPARDGAQRDVRVSTTTAIDEPVVTIVLSIGCSSTMTRRFVAFIDPPPVQLADATPADPGFADAPRIATQTAALADLARRADASKRSVAQASLQSGSASERRAAGRAARAAGSQSGAQIIAATGHPRSASALRHSRMAAASNRGSAHLQLDGPRAFATAPKAPASAVTDQHLLTASAADPHPEAASAPPLIPAATPAAEVAAVAAPAPLRIIPSAADAAKAEHERMLALERSVETLRDESIATKKNVGMLQARLREAENERYSNPLVYALAAAALLFALMAAVQTWLRPAQRRRSRWFDAAAARHARTTRAAEREAAEMALAIPKPLTSTDKAELRAQHLPEPSGFAPMTAPATIGGLEVTTVLGPEMSRALLTPAAGAGSDEAKKTGDLSMEELIDLEQQAEFFVVLGQDEAAMALLDNYTRGAEGKSPLPYLQLLEIHQRRGDEAAYDKVRHAFNARFEANAPDWSSDIHFGRTLVDYPQTIARLQALWATPLSAMQALDALLFRRHAVDETFDFPAYRELLFLYSIARELSGHVETDFGSIDLFLPLEDAAPPQTMTGGLELAVDLDVSRWPEGATANDLQIRRTVNKR